MTKLKLFFGSYILTTFALFFYSFTQVDLNLTLSEVSIYQILQKQFQYIGFFQRPLSALLFSIISFLLFIFYLSFLYLSKKNKLNILSLRNIVFFTFLILVFSYNAFSYDLFNYIFDVKILAHYGQNPYFYRPIDFPEDPMLNFMRWTHRFYPYGPTWLILTVPLSFLGLNLFLPTFFLFKIMIGLTYLGSVYLIYKISETLFAKNKIFNTVFFALNPLVLIEGLVSAHNDFPLVFFGLLAIYLYLQKKKIYSFIAISFSIGIKFLTAVLFPVFACVFFLERLKRKVNWEYVFLASIILSIPPLLYASFRTTFQPWYLILPLALGALISKKYYIFIPGLVSSFFSFLIYAVYVYMTDYAPSFPQTIFNLEIAGLLTGVFLTLAFAIKRIVK